MEPDQEIRLSVGTWAKDNVHRFSFFASNKTQSAERSLDVDQLDVWEECKNEILHLFATLDQKTDINVDRLLAVYGHRLLSEALIDDFALQWELSKEKISRTLSRLMSDRQIEIIVDALRLRATRPFNLDDFTWLLGSFFFLELSKVQCTQNESSIRICLSTDRIDGAEIQIKWLRYLFCPLELNMEVDWHLPLPAKGPDEQINSHILDVPFHQIDQRPSKWSRIVELCGPFLRWSWRWFVATLKKAVFLIWVALRTAINWLLRTFSMKQIVAVSTIVLSMGVAWIVADNLFFNREATTIAIVTQTRLTHEEEIESIGGMLPYEAIKKGLANVANAPYRANKKLYRPITRQAARGYRRTGIASHYGKKKAGLTVSGAVFDPNRLTAAHETLPIPSTIRVTNLENNISKKLIVNDRGPFSSGRIINVSEGAARALGFHHAGTTRVLIEVVEPPTSNK
jgi:rare lipoprotein A (peptidoglycan hydrolase)